jgi:ABC-type spermidine/putrescine transport system permease subunit II
MALVLILLLLLLLLLQIRISLKQSTHTEESRAELNTKKVGVVFGVIRSIDRSILIGWLVAVVACRSTICTCCAWRRTTYSACLKTNRTLRGEEVRAGCSRKKTSGVCFGLAIL